MVKLINLDADDFHGRGDYHDPTDGNPLSLGGVDRPNPNYHLPFAAALSCYP